jgi:hypothetical protein
MIFIDDSEEAVASIFRVEECRIMFQFFGSLTGIKIAYVQLQLRVSKNYVNNIYRQYVVLKSIRITKFCSFFFSVNRPKRPSFHVNIPSIAHEHKTACVRRREKEFKK